MLIKKVYKLDRLLFHFEWPRVLVYAFLGEMRLSKQIQRWCKCSVCAYTADFSGSYGRFEPRILAYGLASAFCIHGYRGGLCMRCRPSWGSPYGFGKAEFEAEQRMVVMAAARDKARLQFTYVFALPGIHATILSCVHWRHGNHVHPFLHRDTARLRQCSKSIWTILSYDTMWLSQLRCGCCCGRCEVEWLYNGWICRPLWAVA